MATRFLTQARALHGASSETGLTDGEVAAQRARFGPNDVLEQRRHPWWETAADTARDPMLWFLVVTSALYAAVGEAVEAATLAAAVVPLASMDAYLHRRTAASTEGLRSRLAARARVSRDGREVEIPARDVVPGDLAVLAAGMAVPADGALVAAADVQVDESSISGESVPVRKRALRTGPVSDEAAIATEHWVYAGTRVLAGSGRLRVVHTGADTLYGEIVRMAALGGVVRTPLQRAITRFVWVLSAGAVIACLLLAFARIVQGQGPLDALVSALTLAVAALPEELPVVFTFFLGVGVYRLARRHALVRRAAAVENVGRITTICSDKTGTLTEGRLALTHLRPADGIDEARLGALAGLATRAENGDPLDIAIAEAQGPAPMDAVRIASFPFTEERKRETAVLRRADGSAFAVSKGAPETILGFVADDAAGRARWAEDANALARDGHKVIACAFAALDAGWNGDEPTSGYTFAGLLAFEDPVRAGVTDAVQRCRASGIRVVMVTGDHPLTAAAVARAIGIGTADPVVTTGDELAARLADGAPIPPDVDVVARATPIQKLALVQSLQRCGEIVAVTGDGVNDVPALQCADVGIAMGERGTQSAREVAPIVLLDDDFATIVGAIAEGRQLFRNLQHSFRYLLMMHLPLVITATLIPLAGYPLLYLPIHVVWLELIMHPTALLAFQAPATAVAGMPRTSVDGIRLFTRQQWFAVAMIAVALTTFVVGGFLRAYEEGIDVGHARGLAVLTLAFASAGLVVVATRLRTAAARGIAVATVLVSLGLVQSPFTATRLHVVPLHAIDLAMATGWALVVAVLASLLDRSETAMATGERVVAASWLTRPADSA
jgi:Ca2+-transporting ATPase